MKHVLRLVLPGLLTLAASVPLPAGAARIATGRATMGTPVAATPPTMTISAADPRQLLAFARSYGKASLDTDRDGDPHIKGRLDGQDYQIFLLRLPQEHRLR